MARAITGNRRLIPDGMEPIEWASAVWQAMDDFGFSQDEAKKYVADVEGATKAETEPSKDKMVRTSIDK